MTRVSHTAVVLCKQDRALLYRLVSDRIRIRSWVSTQHT